MKSSLAKGKNLVVWILRKRISQIRFSALGTVICGNCAVHFWKKNKREREREQRTDEKKNGGVLKHVHEK